MQIGFKPANGEVKVQMVTDRGRVTNQRRRDKADSGTGMTAADACRPLTESCATGTPFAVLNDSGIEFASQHGVAGLASWEMK